MTSFFNMIVNGIGSILFFFSKWTLFSNSASLLSNLRLLSRKTLVIILISVSAFYIVTMFAFLYFVIDSIINVYNLISAILLKMQTMSSGSGQTSPVLQPLFLILNSSGVAAGFNAIFPFIASALTFRLLLALYKIITFVHGKIITFYQRNIYGITAA